MQMVTAVCQNLISRKIHWDSLEADELLMLEVFRGSTASKAPIHSSRFDLSEFGNSGDCVAIRFISSRNRELLSVSGSMEATQISGLES